MAASYSIFDLVYLPARAARISVGAWLTAYDAIAGVVRDPAHAMERVEWRGALVERTLVRRWRRMRRDGRGEIRTLADSAFDTALLPVRWVKRELTATGVYAEDEMERQVEKVLDRLGIPSRDRLDRLGQEIEALSAKIDLELMRLEDHEKTTA